MFGKPSVSAFAVFFALVHATSGCGAGDAEADDDGGGAGGSQGGGGGQEDEGGSGGNNQPGAGGAAGGASGPGAVGGAHGGQGGSAAGAGGNTPGAGGASGSNPYGLPTNRPILIQPLGDSITEGKGTDQEASYRRPLWKKLKDARYNVDFVGSRKLQLGDAPPFFKDYDPDHEGHYGWKLAEVIKPENLGQWLKLYTPDVALVHLGTNDSAAGAATLVTNTETLVKQLRADNPAIVIVLAQLIQPGPTQQGFNSMLPALAQKLTTPMSPILVVNQTLGFTNADTIDGIHPNPSGQEKMATKWFASLMTFLPTPQ